VIVQRFPRNYSAGLRYKSELIAVKAYPYREVFNAVEKRLIEYGSETMDPQLVRFNLDKFKQLSRRENSDDDYFSTLVFVTFYSGFKAAIVTARRHIILRHFPSWRIVANYSEENFQEIFNDPEMIRHERKIRACIGNAKIFASLIEKHGSIKNYIDSYAPTDSFENLLLLKEALEAAFDYLGGITVYHFMTDIGMPVLKPDRVMSRIFLRLGLLETEGQLLKAVLQGRKFAEATGHPIRYIDIVFVAYGQASSKEFGVTRGICLKTMPRCSACMVQTHCNYFDNSLLIARS